MLGIVTTVSEKQNSFFSFLRPYHEINDCIGAENVTVYTLHPAWKLLFPSILKQLGKKHSSLIFSEEFNLKEPSLAPLFLKRFQEILSLAHRGTLQKIALLCKEKDHRLWPLLETVSPFSQTVSVVTDDNLFFDSISEKAIWQLGLTVNQRTVSQLEQVDLVILLSGEFDLKKLCQGSLMNLSDQPANCTLPTLAAVTNTAVSAFLARHPHLRLNPSHLLSQNDKITNLIWKYC